MPARVKRAIATATVERVKGKGRGRPTLLLRGKSMLATVLLLIDHSPMGKGQLK